MTAVQWEKICWKCRSKISIIIDLTRRLRSRFVHCSHGSLHMWWRDCTRGGLRLTNGTSIIINHVDRGVITSARTLHTVTSISRKMRPPTSMWQSHVPGWREGGGRFRRRFEVIVGVRKPKKRREGPAPMSLGPPRFCVRSHNLAVFWGSVCYGRRELRNSLLQWATRPARASTHIRFEVPRSVTRPPWLRIEIGHYQLFTTLYVLRKWSNYPQVLPGNK